MNSLPGLQQVNPADYRMGAPASQDTQRSPDEQRIIRETTNDEVELFLRINQIDTAAARELRNEPPHVALAVLDRGPLRACVNPSGALVARIRDAKRGLLQGGNSRFGGVPPPSALDPNSSELDKFLVENRIDQAGISSLRSESKEIQTLVLAKGPLVNTTNPSASLMARIRNIKQDHQAGKIAAPPAGLPALPPPAPAPVMPALALEDNRPSTGAVGNNQLNDEALKAIAKLTSPPPAPAPSEGKAEVLPDARAEAMAEKQSRSQSPRRQVNGASDEKAGSDISNDKDKRLQQEAMRAIAAMQDDI
mmetsp:Transcript_120812/g.225875  ORF Transcript_120812/g.225875 Transcript_120812/m.225875 type:complete len:307 (+) Transcript_120812:83-1003(+)